MCSWPTRVAVVTVVVPPPPPPPPELADAGLMGVSGMRFSWAAVPAAVPTSVSFGDVAGVRMPRLSYLPFGELADDDEDEEDDEEDDEDEDDDEDKLEEVDAKN